MLRAILLSLALLTQPALAAETPAVTDALNAIRAQGGQAPLRHSEALQAAAQGHASDMAKHNYFSHTGRNGSSHGTRARAQGFGRCFLAENIALNGGGLGAVLNTWMESSAHRKNILNRKSQVYGLAKGGSDRWVLMLGEDC